MIARVTRVYKPSAPLRAWTADVRVPGLKTLHVVHVPSGGEALKAGDLVQVDGHGDVTHINGTKVLEAWT